MFEAVGDTMNEGEANDYWPLQDAKARFSELVNRCTTEGPQTVTKHGKPAVVVLPWSDCRSLQRRKQRLVDFLASAPQVELDVVRSREAERELSL